MSHVVVQRFFLLFISLSHFIVPCHCLMPLFDGFIPCCQMSLSKVIDPCCGPMLFPCCCPMLVFSVNVPIQCGANIRIFDYIRIYLGKYIHSSKYLLIFSKANIFGYSFVIYLFWQISSDIHSSNIYDSKFIWIFIVSQKCSKIGINSPKCFNMGPKKLNMKMAKIVQNNLVQSIWYLNVIKYFGWIYSFTKIFMVTSQIGSVGQFGEKYGFVCSCFDHFFGVHGHIPNIYKCIDQIFV